MTALRAFPLKQPEAKSELMTVEEVAERWGKSPQTIRKWIDLDMQDGRHRVPGGRREGGSTVIIRAVFERAVVDGIEPTPGSQYPSLDIPAAIAKLRDLAHEANSLADSLSVSLTDRKAVS